MNIQAIFPKIVPALLTPCSEPGVIDVPALQSLSRFLVAEGADGLFVASSTGGMPLLGRPERLKLMEAVASVVPDDVAVFAGASGTGIPQVLDYIQDAAGAGADCAVVMPPFFVKLSSAQLVDYAYSIADVSPLPIILYHHLRMPTPINADCAVKLAEHPNIIGMKETSGCSDRIVELSECLRGTNFRLYQGSEALVLPSLEQGGWGCITALSNLAPKLHRDILDAYERGEHEQAKQLQEQLTRLWRVFKLPSLGESFAHFLQAMIVPLWRQGLLNSPHTLFNGYKLDASYEKEILDFYDSWLNEFKTKQEDASVLNG